MPRVNPAGATYREADVAFRLAEVLHPPCGLTTGRGAVAC